MRVRYGHRKFDLMVTMYPEALEFVLKDCKDVFADAPILALYLPNISHMPKNGRPRYRAFPVRDIIGTIEIAMKLVPGAKRAYVVSGATKSTEREKIRLDSSQEWEGRIEFLYLSHLPLEIYWLRLQRAPRLHYS